MSGLELLILKSVAALSLLYVSYWFLLRNGTNYAWNRFFLLTTMIASIVFPFIKFSFQPSTRVFSALFEPIVISGYLPVQEQQISTYSLSILSIIYISGAVFFILRFLSKLGRIHYLYTRFPKTKYKGFTAVILDEDHSPFTFFNILFISRSDYQDEADAEIIAHERAHRDLYHSFDIILLEILTIIQWFNPIVWLLHNSLKSEHEFMADQKVLLKGYDKVRYQKLLFEKSLGISALNLTNNFNYSLLKKRLKMMTKNNPSLYVKFKYFLSLPVVLIVFAFISLNITSYAQDETVYEQVDVMAKYKDGDIDGVRKHIALNLKYPESAIKHQVTAKVFVGFVVDKSGKVTNVKIIRTDIEDHSDKEVVVASKKSEKNSPETNKELIDKALADMEAEAIRVVESLGDFVPAQKDSKNVSTRFTFPIIFALK